jgi:hypothetical protein
VEGEDNCDARFVPFLPVLKPGSHMYEYNNLIAGGNEPFRLAAPSVQLTRDCDKYL